MVDKVSVAPRAGAWIEAPVEHMAVKFVKSLPVRERGLKHISHDY